MLLSMSLALSLSGKVSYGLILESARRKIDAILLWVFFVRGVCSAIRVVLFDWY